MKTVSEVREDIRKNKSDLWSYIFSSYFAILWEFGFVLFMVVLLVISQSADADPLMTYGFHGGLVVIWSGLAFFKYKRKRKDLDLFYGLLDDYAVMENKLEYTEQLQEYEARMEYYRAVYEVEGHRGIN